MLQNDAPSLGAAKERPKHTQRNDLLIYEGLLASSQTCPDHLEQRTAVTLPKLPHRGFIPFPHEGDPLRNGRAIPSLKRGCDASWCCDGTAGRSYQRRPR